MQIIVHPDAPCCDSCGMVLPTCTSSSHAASCQAAAESHQCSPEVYPPHSWVAQCKALVPREEVWAIIYHPSTGWSQWLEAWDSGFTPTQAVGCALLDVLAPEVGAAHVLNS